MQGWLKKIIRLAASRPAKKHKSKETQWNLTRPSSLKNLTKAQGGLKSKSRTKIHNFASTIIWPVHLQKWGNTRGLSVMSHVTAIAVTVRWKMRKQNCKMIKPTQQPRLKQKHAGWQTRDVKRSGKIILPSHLASHLAQSLLRSNNPSRANSFGIKGSFALFNIAVNDLISKPSHASKHWLKNVYVLQCDANPTFLRSSQIILRQQIRLVLLMLIVLFYVSLHTNHPVYKIYKWVCFFHCALPSDFNQINPFNLNPSFKFPFGLALRKLCKNVWSTRAFREQLVLVQPPIKIKWGMRSLLTIDTIAE